ncbi:alkaline phosphatase D family protein [Fulvivirga sediminis]|uniref:Alkaline phosphatase D family protein n=1 Tax=Fulvivirga sediminis TaxID=2803949 RepID=A0A937F7P7_9BACT|nr:alkaline phosphatase D family protein [Fulvivirga sediminis]MBL3656144.1 alkaline phosphatase D family protein [Fulvivirga sediminis]
MNKEKILKNLSRRSFLRNSVVAAAGVGLAPTLLSSCNEDDDNTPPFNPEGNPGFFEGVASFDPTQDRVVLWSRYTPATNETGKPAIILDVATDTDFKTVVASETVEVDAGSDNTIYVDVSNLKSNTRYYYRFRNEMTATISVIGQTKTLPAAGEVTQINLAVLSCSNYQSGLFNVYGAVAQSEADVVVHLGDYIYEYPAGGYGTSELTAQLGRRHEPTGEIIALDDYRTRYRQYRRDPQLQEAHRLKPFICVWDDHEIANDAYTDGAENHQDNEGSFEVRKSNAIQAWAEYLPARVSDNAKIYRSFDLGGIVNLMMLDTRIIGRNKQLSYSDYFTPSGLDREAFLADWMDDDRTILGQEQLSWLQGQLSGSGAAWQVLGNQVLMGKVHIPLELLMTTAEITANGVTPELFKKYNELVEQLVTIKSRMMKNDPSLTNEEIGRVQNALPYNLDSWDGYPAEREVVFAAAAGKKLISIAGDTHNAWHIDLTDAQGHRVGAELATSSVSSPGFDGIFGTDPAVIDPFEQSLQLLINDLKYLNASDRGYVMASFTQSEANSEWRFVSTLATENISTTTDYTTTER